MKKRICFTGVGCAIVTPFKNGEIDYHSLSRLIDMQISCKTDALIVGGTTGEAATLSDGEREALFAFAVEKVAGRAKIILGTGSCDTKRAVCYTRLAKRLGADGALSVTPYYNKGTEDGTYEHFMRIAEAADIPTIMYNVPTRTCVNLDIKTIGKLSEHENIAGLKESSDSLKRLSELATLGKTLPLYSGNDYANLIFYSLGAVGAISVIANIYPKETREVFEAYKSGKGESARELQNASQELIEALFLETNPSVIKFALERHGICSSEVRLPLTRPTSKTRERLAKALENYEKTLHG